MLAVESIAVGVAQRNHLLLLAIEMEPIDLVDGFVAHVKKARLIPHRSLGKTKARAHHSELGIAIHQIPEMWRFGMQSKLSMLGWCAGRARYARCDQQQGCDANPGEDLHAAIHEDAFPPKSI